MKVNSSRRLKPFAKKAKEVGPIAKQDTKSWKTRNAARSAKQDAYKLANTQEVA